ncbi:DUF6371 domain-containing protein (plasmid) [Bacteroides thetaiotaomicron]|nr:DUF6371 domain-containing protein [Bacteroides thetaiotaomicron]
MADRQDGQGTHGKVMQYNPEDGHRIKGGQTSAVNWIHSILKKQRVLAEDWQLSQCLFGEHLLKTHPDKVVVLRNPRECRYRFCYLPDYVWLATGGKSQMRGRETPCTVRANRASLSRCRWFADGNSEPRACTFVRWAVSDIIKGKPP